jgi:hypothetical protein
VGEAAGVKRLDRFREFQGIGCIACRQRGVFSYADVHHLLSGGKRRGDQYTIPLCPWHHRGMPPAEVNEKEAVRYYGPSLAKQPKLFRAVFGDDGDLLEKVEKLLCAST